MTGDHVLREGAAARERRDAAEDTLADMPARRAAAGADDGAGEIATQSAWRASRRQQTQMALADLPVERIERRGVDANLELVRAGNRFGDLLDVQDVGGAETLEAQCLHHRRPQAGRDRRIARHLSCSLEPCAMNIPASSPMSKMDGF